jgi:hypothetical protein
VNSHPRRSEGVIHVTDGTPFHNQHHDIARQHHDIARQHHDAARRTAEEHRRATQNRGHAPGHPTGSPIRHGRGDQHGQLDWDRPLGQHRMAGTMGPSRRSGGGTVIFALLVVILVLGGIAALIFRADGAYQQGEDRAKAAYCKQASELTGETAPGC